MKTLKADGTEGMATVEMTYKEGGKTRKLVLHGCFVENDKNLLAFIEKEIKPATDRKKFDCTKYFFYTCDSELVEKSDKITNIVYTYHLFSKPNEAKSDKLSYSPYQVFKVQNHIFLLCDSEELNKCPFLKEHHKKFQVLPEAERLAIACRKFYGISCVEENKPKLIPLDLKNPQSSNDVFQLEDLGPVFLENRKYLVGSYRKTDNGKISISTFGNSQANHRTGFLPGAPNNTVDGGHQSGGPPEGGLSTDSPPADPPVLGSSTVSSQNDPLVGGSPTASSPTNPTVGGSPTASSTTDPTVGGSPTASSPTDPTVGDSPTSSSPTDTPVGDSPTASSPTDTPVGDSPTVSSQTDSPVGGSPTASSSTNPTIGGSPTASFPTYPTVSGSPTVSSQTDTPVGGSATASSPTNPTVDDSCTVSSPITTTVVADQLSANYTREDYRTFLLNLSRELTTADLKAFKYAIDVPDGTGEGMTTGIKLFDYLEKKGDIGQFHLSFLSEKFSRISREDLSKKVKEFMIDLKGVYK